MTYQHFHLANFVNRFTPYNDTLLSKYISWLEVGGVTFLSQNGPFLCSEVINRVLLNDEHPGQHYHMYFSTIMQAQGFLNRMRSDRGCGDVDEAPSSTFLRIMVDAPSMLYFNINIHHDSRGSRVEDVLDQLCLTAQMIGYDGTDLVCGPHALWDIARRQIMLNRSHTSQWDLIRNIISYSARGFNAPDLVELLEDITNV